MPALNSTLGFLLSLGIIKLKIIGQTEFGNIEGTYSTGRDGRIIYEFLGIPYANPPIGDLRFSPPIEWNSSWEGLRPAKKFGPNCKQFHLFRKSVMGSEDCLFLNVYTHRYKKEDESNDNDQTNATPLSPVIVYIHGGLFMHGSGDLYKPKYMLDSDVVLVTVNYRLGVLGFLNLEAENILGNQGLKDQVLALKWVQRNIENFGGDPNLVTIMGESAGGACVHYQMLSPLSRGLFHRAISQSGNAFVSWASQDHPQHQAILLANELGCTNLTMGEVAKCLRDLDSDKISESQRSASDLLHDRYALYASTIEQPGDDSFISKLPQDIIRSGNFAKVPWLVGVNSEEGLIYSAPIIRNETIRTELNKNWANWAPILFRFSDHPKQSQIAAQIWDYYMGNNKTAEISMETLHNITTFLSDRSFFEGLHNSLTLHRGQHPIFPYVYSYEGRFSVGKLLLGMNFKLPVMADVIMSQGRKWFQTKILRRVEKSYGVAHGDELPLLFKMPLQAELKDKGKPDGDLAISKALTTTWAAFAKDGVPPAIFNTSWPPLLSLNPVNSNRSDSADNLTQPGQGNYNNSPIKFLKINLTPDIVDEPFHERAGFWRKLNLLPFKRPAMVRMQDNADECNEVDNNELNVTSTSCNADENMKSYLNFNLENVYSIIPFIKSLFA